MAVHLPITTVDASFQELKLNFRNKIFHSFVHQFSKDEPDSGLSVKLTIQGLERYRIGDRNHAVHSGNYVLVNHHQAFECRIKSQDIVEGLCFYLDPQVVTEMSHAKLTGNGKLLDEGPFLQCSPQLFTEKVYGLGGDQLGKFLQNWLPKLRDKQLRNDVNFEEFFLQMSEALVDSHLHTQKLIGKLANERPSTRAELYRRVALAKDLIDAEFLRELSLDDLAATAMLSKYHFLRTFKEIYDCSPYQYLLQKRLVHSATLLRNGQRSLAEIATETGFTDRRAFNKAFRKQFGILPSEHRESA